MDRPLPDLRDYFTDPSLLVDPYDYFETMRAAGPVCQSVRPDVVMVTGFDEALEVVLNTEDFSTVIAMEGPTRPLPFDVDGDDISDLIEEYRPVVTPTNTLMTLDDDRHSAVRSLIMGLFTPSRMKANEAYMTGLADQMLREGIAKGRCEIIKQIADPYVTLVVADMLGVPAADREKFRDLIDSGPPPGNIDATDERHVPLEVIEEYFVEYVRDRRANPRGDVLTELATSTYPDGTLPEAVDVVKTAVFLFAAGQDTSAKLVGNSIRRLAEDPALQRQLRNDRSLIVPFLEEMLRLEGSSKVTFRLARKKTRIGDMEIPAGKKIFISLAAVNRDARRWEDPHAFKLDRPRIREHLAFSRGKHVCAGAPLARVEVRLLLDRLFDLTSDFTLSEEHHGPANDRKFEYEASYIVRGLEYLYVDLKPQ